MKKVLSIILITVLILALFVDIDKGINPQSFEENGLIYTAYELDEGHFITRGYWDYNEALIISIADIDLVILDI